MPALTKFYPGITPAVIDTMTRREVNEYIVAMDKALAD